MEHKIAISQNVYFDLYKPASSLQRLPLLIALHGYAGNKESMMKLARRIDEEKFVIASLQGPSHFFILGDGLTFDPKATSPPKIGFSWRTNFKPEDSIEIHHQAILGAIETAQREAGADNNRVFLLGFSQSVALNYRFALTHPNLVSGIIAICGGVPGDLETGSYQPSPQTSVLHIGTDRDEYYSVEQTQSFQKRLQKWVRSVEIEIHEGSHAVPLEALPRMRSWLASRSLEK
ncbi:MAG: hypothetical protein JNN15_07950 [Blastocatellia bacterium]|nr:hypothetical protein [Blastocatellia bacterium]